MYPVQSNSGLGADRTGWIAFAAVLTLAVGYGIWEWRHEISALTRRVLGSFKHSK